MKFLVSVAWLIVAGNTMAHHGFPLHFYATDRVSFEGRIQSVSIRNPHSSMEILALETDGTTTLWTCETQAKTLLDRKGLFEKDLIVGDSLVIEGSRARRAEHECEIGTVQLSDGRSFTFRSPQGRSDISVNTANTIPNEQQSSVFGIWVRDSYAGSSAQEGVLGLITRA